MPCRQSVKELCFISYLLFIINRHQLLSTTLFLYSRCIYLLDPQSPQDRSSISPQSLTCQIVLQFTLQFLILFSGWRCRPVFLSLDCSSCYVNILPCLIGCKLEHSLKDSLSCSRTSSVHEPSNIYHWRSSRPTLQPQPTKCSTSSVESRETYSYTYHTTKGKRSKLPLSFGSTFCRWTASISLWKLSPSVSIKSTNFDNGRTPSFPLSILSNTLAAVLEKSESGSSSTSSSASYIIVFLLVLPLDYQLILPFTHH